MLLFLPLAKYAICSILSNFMSGSNLNVVVLFTGLPRIAFESTFFKVGYCKIPSKIFEWHALRTVDALRMIFAFITIISISIVIKQKISLLSPFTFLFIYFNNWSTQIVILELLFICYIIYILSHWCNICFYFFRKKDKQLSLLNF